jgi:hypothetical protein
MDSTWLTSKEVQELLKISGCELMYLRVSGKLKFKKQGNAYYYQVNQTKPSNTKIYYKVHKPKLTAAFPVTALKRRCSIKRYL